MRWLPTAANTGATTMAVNGLTAKNLTKCGTTALVANDLTTAAVAIATYDGTQFQLLNPQATGCGSSGGGPSSFPFTIVQSHFYIFFAGSPQVVTFPNTTAASGNTAVILVTTDTTATVTTPSGWTLDFNCVSSATGNLVNLYHKATAADTSASFTLAVSSTFSVYFFEVAGSRTFDTSACSNISGSTSMKPPSLTPTAGSMVVSAAGYNWGAGTNGQSPAAPISGDWTPEGYPSNAAASARSLGVYIYKYAASGSAIQSPNIDLLNSVSGGTNAETATFSFK